MPVPPILVFDLDGTVVDSAPDLTGTLNRIVTGEGLQPITLDNARTMMGHGAKALLTRAFQLNGHVPDEARFEPLLEAFLADYEAHIADHSRPFPGAVEALDRFAAGGWRLAICTNKLTHLARKLLTELQLIDRFVAISGADSHPVRKPDPGHLMATIAAAGGDPGNAVMVGDSATDIATAKAAGIPIVAVDFGYSAEPVGNFEPDVVISHFDELDAAIAAIRAGRPVA